MWVICRYIFRLDGFRVIDRYQPEYRDNKDYAHLRTVNENGFDDTGRNILNLNSHVNKDKDVQMMDYRKYKKLQELKEKNEIFSTGIEVL